MIRYLINTARPLIFSTAPPPPAVAGALAALELLGSGPTACERLKANARVLRRALADEGFPVPRTARCTSCRSSSASERAAMRLCQAGDRARRVRTGDPPADGRAGELAAAAHGDGLPHPRRAASCGTRARPGGAARIGLDPRRSARRCGACDAERRAGPDVERHGRDRGAASPADGAEARAIRRPLRPRTRARTRVEEPARATPSAPSAPFDIERETRRHPRGLALAADGRAAARVRGLLVTGTDTGVGKTHPERRADRGDGGRGRAGQARTSRS